MDQQTFQKEQFLEKRRQFYVKHPDVEKWVKQKRLIRRAFMIFILVHALLTTFLLFQMQDMGGAILEIFKVLVHLFLLWIFTNPEGSWRANLILYFWALTNFFILFTNLGLMFESIQYYVDYPFLYGVISLIRIMEVIVPFLFLGIAIYFTVPAKHRSLSEEALQGLREIGTQLQQPIPKP